MGTEDGWRTLAVPLHEENQLSFPSWLQRARRGCPSENISAFPAAGRPAKALSALENSSLPREKADCAVREYGTSLRGKRKLRYRDVMSCVCLSEKDSTKKPKETGSLLYLTSVSPVFFRGGHRLSQEEEGLQSGSVRGALPRSQGFSRFCYIREKSWSCGCALRANKSPSVSDTRLRLQTRWGSVMTWASGSSRLVNLDTTHAQLSGERTVISNSANSAPLLISVLCFSQHSAISL